MPELSNAKDSPEAIRQNCEDGILRQIYDGCKTGKINGNFGMHQYALAAAAVALDQMPETGEWIDWVMQEGVQDSYAEVPGGNVLPQLVNLVDRDGFGNEYRARLLNYYWLTNLIEMAEVLYGYETYPTGDLYQTPNTSRCSPPFPS